jgi:rhodanese-related sulfurtransferase
MSSHKKQVQSQRVFRWGWLVAGALVIAAAVLSFIFLNSGPATQTLPQEVSVQDAAELRAQGAFILDVRQPEEWQEVHIPGATLIPLGELAGRLDEVPKDKPVVVYCRSGNRSREGRDILQQAGFEQVTSMAGGIRAWLAAGLPAVSGQ